MSKAILLLVFVVFLIVVGPILTIWSLNTLFPVLAIPFTFDTWIATVILGSLFKTSVSKKD
jgi:hypothetical protein